MELRLLVAYGIITVLAGASVVTGVIIARRRARRRLRMRGIKKHEVAHRDRRTTARHGRLSQQRDPGVNDQSIA